MKKQMKYFLLPLMLLGMTACSGTEKMSADTKGGDGGSDPTYSYDDALAPTGGDYIEEGGYSEGIPDGDIEGSGDEDPGTSVDNQARPKPGQLTCSALDDNKYYDYWKSLATSNQEGQGQFQYYREHFAFNTFNRLDLTINNGNDVSVKVKGDTYATKVDNLHKAYLFPQVEQEEYTVEISYLDNNDERQTIEKVVTNEEVIDLENTSTIYNNLEIMFVIDATGSMSDEMAYLKSEIDDVISKVKEENATANISLAMMVYRDEGDEYVTKYSDFTTDIASQQTWLAKQSANGGGDFPEAVQTALSEAMNKQWSAKSTKLLFHVADAPSHDKDVQSWNNTTLLAARKGIKIISVASSGIDLKTEYFFRSQSLLTSGQYVYLTNDSGIGGSHLDATTEEKLVVEYLNECLVRLINGYYTGEFAEPVSWRQSNQNQQ